MQDDAPHIPEMYMITISPKDIVIPPDRIRSDVGDLYELGSSILENGFIHPITVRKTPAEDYELVAGFRRLMSIQILNLDAIQVNVIERDLTELQVLELESRENTLRKSFTTSECWKMVERIWPMLEAEAAARKSEAQFGKSPGHTVPLQQRNRRETVEIVGELVGLGKDSVRFLKEVYDARYDDDSGVRDLAYKITLEWDGCGENCLPIRTAAQQIRNLKALGDKPKSKRAKPVDRQKAELEETVKTLKAELSETAAENNKLKQEVQTLRQQMEAMRNGNFQEG